MTTVRTSLHSYLSPCLISPLSSLVLSSSTSSTSLLLTQNSFHHLLGNLWQCLINNKWELDSPPVSIMVVSPGILLHLSLPPVVLYAANMGKSSSSNWDLHWCQHNHHDIRTAKPVSHSSLILVYGQLTLLHLPVLRSNFR